MQVVDVLVVEIPYDDMLLYDLGIRSITSERVFFIATKRGTSERRQWATIDAVASFLKRDAIFACDLRYEKTNGSGERSASWAPSWTSGGPEWRWPLALSQCAPTDVTAALALGAGLDGWLALELIKVAAHELGLLQRYRSQS